RKDRRGGRMLKHKRQREEQDARTAGPSTEMRSPHPLTSPLVIKHSKKNSPALSLTAEQM
nr:estrogen receptor, tER [Trachemys scripta=red-eared slider turtles, oviduct target tissue, Peptide Partial, 59 aa] [Trachemys scripta]AAB37705.1 estrogen receptor, ER [Trachemys scripta=red-eared slider turtles, adult females, oviducts, Peptide Partial, 59 aa] [Trachemys scripta]